MAETVANYIWSGAWIMVGIVLTILAIMVIGFVIKGVAIAAIEAFREIRDELTPEPVYEATPAETAPKPDTTNVIDFETINAIAHIRKHESMQFVTKT